MMVFYVLARAQVAGGRIDLERGIEWLYEPPVQEQTLIESIAALFVLPGEMARRVDVIEEGGGLLDRNAVAEPGPDLREVHQADQKGLVQVVLSDDVDQ